MNIDELNHNLTPDALRAVNQDIIACLERPDEQSPGFAVFYELIQQRDTLVQQFLQQSSPEQAKAFAAKELLVNDRLKDVAQTLLKSAKADASHFIRSQAAIKKYK